MTDRLLYLDTSAIVKLVVPEAESDALVAFLASTDLVVTSRVSAIETRRAAGRHGNVDPARLEAVLARLSYLELDDNVAARAGALAPIELGTLDAIHLASALELGPELDALVVYDARLAEAAAIHGLPVAAPS